MTATAPTTSLGRLIRYTRIRRDLSLRKLARQLDVPPGYLSRVEAAGELPNPAFILRVPDVLAGPGRHWLRLAKETHSTGSPSKSTTSKPAPWRLTTPKVPARPMIVIHLTNQSEERIINVSLGKAARIAGQKTGGRLCIVVLFLG